jgi:hypothetical protein
VSFLSEKLGEGVSSHGVERGLMSAALESLATLAASRGSNVFGRSRHCLLLYSGVVCIICGGLTWYDEGSVSVL